MWFLQCMGVVIGGTTGCTGCTFTVECKFADEDHKFADEDQSLIYALSMLSRIWLSLGKPCSLFMMSRPPLSGFEYTIPSFCCTQARTAYN